MEIKTIKYLIFVSTVFLLSGLRAQKQDTYFMYLQKQTEQSLKQHCQIRNSDTLDCRFDNQLFTVYRQMPGESFNTWGLVFFPEEKKLLSPLVRHYIERQLLYYLILSPRQWEKHKKINELMLSVNPGAAKTVRRVADSLAGIEIKLEKNKYEINLSTPKGVQSIRMKFPSVFGILAGMDRPTAQKLLYKQLAGKSNDTLHHPIHVIIRDSSKRIKDHDLYVQKGGHFLIRSLNGNLYFDKNNQNLVFDTGHIAPSLSNLLLSDLSEKHSRTVHLEMPVYNKSYTTDIPLNTLLSHFDKEFIKFFGVEKVTDKSVEATLVLAHKYLGYVHLFHIQTSVKDLFKQNGVINMRMYSYIPIHNIASLMNDINR